MDIVGQECEPSVISMTRRKLHELVRASPQQLLDRKLQDLEKNLVELTKCPPEESDELQKVVKTFKVVYKRKWLACYSTENRFLGKYHEWLKGEIILPTGPLPGSSKGRPSKEFADSSERTKRRRTKKLRENVAVDELTYAAQMSHRASGNNEIAKVIKHVTRSPTSAAKFRKAADIGSKTVATKKHTPEEALIIYTEADLTKIQYDVIHQANKDVYPCYSYIQKAKQDCYPPKNITETIAEVKLQDLLDHTALRLCKYLDPISQKICAPDENSDIVFVLMYKWGCDGSNQVQYKQKFEEEGSSEPFSAEAKQFFKLDDSLPQE